MIYYLLYYGVERAEFDKYGLEALLAQSRSRNGSLEITGKLIYCEGTFIQILEGEEKHVKAVYASIKRDERLVATRVITEGAEKERYFRNWSMDFEEISLANINELENCTHPNVKEYLLKSPAIKLLKLLGK